MAGRVVALHVIRSSHAPVERRERVVAVAGKGVEGDQHFERDGRAVLLMEAGDLADMGLAPGDLREQITVELPGLMELPAGARLVVGGATLEITKPCEPCTHIGELVGVEDAEAFRDHLRGRRGMLARVVATDGAGTIALGDPVEVDG